MTTHFSSGVTNVPGKGQATSLFSGIKQPLITGGDSQEVAYQNDFVIYNASDWDVTSSGSAFQQAQYAGGWLRIGDNAPALLKQSVFLVKKYGSIILLKNGTTKLELL